MSTVARLLRRLHATSSGVAMTEFALALPLLLTAGLWGTETAHLAVTHMRISQLAIQIADNGARIGDTSTLENRKIYESDINDLLVGANLQAGTLEFFDHGRAIISSLEVDEDSGRQYIHWQRCKGLKQVTSSYGLAGEGLGSTTISGIGPAGNQVAAPSGGAVIFVELVYDYQPLVSSKFVGTDPITATAAFVVRDSRDLSQIYQRSSTSPDPVANCSTFTTY